jgi:hypothetical protein
MIEDLKRRNTEKQLEEQAKTVHMELQDNLSNNKEAPPN